MDMLYNVQEATVALEDAQLWVDDEKEYLHAFVHLPGWESTYTLAYTENPKSWRLVKRQEGVEAGEEVIFNLQGVIQEKNLPPVLDDPKTPKIRSQYMQQTVTLTGLGTDTFDKSTAALSQMHAVFSRQFPEGRLAAWQSGSGANTLTLSNRYFTKKSEAAQLVSVPFERDVDPKGILANMLNSKLIHTEENKVKYYLRSSDLGRVYKYTSAKPQNFRVGDIVDVQFALVVYQMRGDNYVLKPMLYSIALLEGRFANDLAVRKSNIIIAPVVGKQLKRKIGYVTQEDNDVDMDRLDKRGRWSELSDMSSERGSVSAESIEQMEKMNLDQ